MLGCVVNRESVPDLIANLHPEDVRQRFAAVDVEVVHDQVDGLCLRVLHRQMAGDLCELKSGPVGRWEGEVPARFGFYRTEDIGRPAPLVFIVLSGFPARCGRRGGADIGVQRDRLFVQTHHGLLRIVWPFIRFQCVLHIGNVVFIEVGHAPHFFPATA